MADERAELLGYFQRELAYLRAMGAGFARDYPKIAARLELDGEESADPHVERLIEAFAFLTGRIQYNLDRDFSEIPAALLQALYPQFAAPVPAMAIARFEVDPGQGKLIGGYPIARHTQLHANSNQGATCTFRTAYPVTLWPLHVADAALEPTDLHDFLDSEHTVAGVLRLRIELMAPEGEIAELGVDRLRFHLDGERNTVYQLYELLFLHCRGVAVRSDRRSAPVRLGPEAIRPVGFDVDEAVLPYPAESHQGYRLLQEYFAFPEKFFFLDLEQLSVLRDSGFDDSFEVVFQIGRFDQPERQQSLEVGVSTKTVRLNCVPAVNLFEQVAEPILINHQKYEYPVIADQRRQAAMEVFSIEDVVSTRPNSTEVIQYEPFYSYRHAAIRDQNRTFWLATRRASNRPNDNGTDMYISLVDLSNRPLVPNVDTLTVRCICTNRDLPSRLSFGSEAGDFEIEGFSAIKKIVALRKPTRSIPPPVGRGLLWRLISHLSLNYLSLVNDGKEALQEILKLYNFSDSTYLEKQILGIESVESTPHFARILSDTGISFVRGVRVQIEFDEEQFVGGGVYLFASVLERFLGLYTAMNSFSQLAVSTKQRREVLREWPPRAGDQVLL